MTMTLKGSKFSIVLVTFNRLQLLKEITQRVLSYDWRFEKFIIINNNSSDGTFEYLNSIVNHDSRLDLVHLKSNVGHGGAISIAFSRLPSDYRFCLLLEDDSIPSEKLPDNLFDVMNRTKFDVISSDGRRVKLGKRVPLKRIDAWEEADFVLWDGAILTQKVINKVGYPVSNWFMMFDDFEYSYRIRKAGFKLGVLNGTDHQILHLGGGEKFSKSTLWRGYYQARNHTLFVRRHFSLFNLGDFLIIQSKWLIAALRASDWKIRIRLRLIGVWHGLRGREGKTLSPTTLVFDGK